MKRSHALVLALLLGAAAVAATFSVLTTTSLGIGAKAAVPAAEIAARNAKLDKAEAAVRRALEKKPPALPKLPKRIDSQSHLMRVFPPAPTATQTPPPTTRSAFDDDHGVEWEDEEDDD
jgi:hypothetical protein